MELDQLKRDLPSIEDGRWVDSSEVPSLKGIRVKVRGHSSKRVRELYAHLERSAPESDKNGNFLTKEARARITREVVSSETLVDIEGLTIGGNPVPVERIRPLLLDEAYEPLVELIAAASFRVDATRASDLEKLKGNLSASSSGLPSTAKKPRRTGRN